MTTIDISHTLSLNILLGDPPGSVSRYHTSFHAGDTIKGSISIRSEVDLQFETLDVFFIGEELTVRHDKSPRRFHHEQYTIPTSSLPSENLIKKHQRYFFPFAFPVPSQLSPTTCQHPITSPLTRQLHLQPPPSFGVPDIAGFGGKLRNDYAPTNCRIIYTLQAQLTRRSLVTEMIQTMLHRTLKIRLKPSSTPALPPPSPPSPSPSLSLSPAPSILAPIHGADPENQNDIDPPPCKTIDIYSSPWKGSKKSDSILLGRLTLSIIAPPRFDMPIRQAITLNLHYETFHPSKQSRMKGFSEIENENHTENINSESTSSSQSQSQSQSQPTLPQIQSLRGSVSATTFFTKTYHTTSPPKKQKDRFGTKLNYAEKVLTEFTHAITETTLAWAQDHPEHGPDIFVSRLLVPVKLSHHLIISTFHSCRMSRVYTLELRVKIQGAETVELCLPIIIAPAEEIDSPPPYCEV
ncbi:hypothetical protein PENSTE_c010G08982 [Penicillium steckii]|uniref:Arrestin-like N-terminal domain-containing protein n=1 Tax=Penicillium steckii TaxID=303698 RepID=A0A1V6T7J1_9EURO|nr:hypothetical protein PENSTE_c010G08982 [Penicillium steckii]